MHQLDLLKFKSQVGVGGCPGWSSPWRPSDRKRHARLAETNAVLVNRTVKPADDASPAENVFGSRHVSHGSLRSVAVRYRGGRNGRRTGPRPRKRARAGKHAVNREGPLDKTRPARFVAPTNMDDEELFRDRLSSGFRRRGRSPARNRPPRRAGFVQAPSWRQRRFKARLPDPREGGPGRHGGRRRRDFPGPGRSERGVGDDGCLVDSKTSDASQPATIKRPKTSWPHYASPRSYAIGVE